MSRAESSASAQGARSVGEAGRKATADPEAAAEPFLQPWQFFLLGGMLAATATVIVATGQSPANIIILSLTVVSVSFVGLGAYHVLRPLVATDLDAPPTIAGRTRAALEREKTLVLRSIKELEFDHAMGKVAKADFDEMSTRLRARAIGLMQQLDAGGGYKEEIAREIEQRLAQDPGAVGAVGAEGAVGAVGAGDVFGGPPEQAAAINTVRKMDGRSIANIGRRRLRLRVPLPYHDWRRVVIGSTDAARRAGTKQASSATAQSSSGTATKVAGSSAPTP
jgi:hypothetical protein